MMQNEFSCFKKILCYNVFMDKFYHVSKIPNIKVLQPQVSTHGKAYVYATQNLEFALLFGSSKSFGDLDGKYGFKNGLPFFYEAYEGAFERRFKDVTCYIYEVKPDTFETGQTDFRYEVVSEKPVEVISCTEVKDLYSYLKKLIAEEKIIFKEYSQEEDYVNYMNEHIKDRIKSFNILNNQNSEVYKFCKLKFPKIMEDLEKNMEKTDEN